MTEEFYRAFEDRYRGSQGLIKKRLEVYLPFIQPLGRLYPGATAIDLGCGRGEFLEVLQSAGLHPKGVDLDTGMLDACRERGMAVQQGDALAYLALLANESQAVVSALHVVEHISFHQLRQLVSEALRVLIPGGLLIIETPNPENIIVATRNFYLDPTHLRPIPPQLLTFVVDYAGFKRIKTVRLQESTELARRSAVSLQDVLQGVSPDYSVIAQKDAAQSILSSNDESFRRDYGLAIETLTARHDNTWRSEIQRVETMVQALEVQLNAIYTSKSWRITKPLREANALLRSTIGGAMRFAVFKGKALARRAPAFKRTVMWALQRSPLLMRLVARFSDTPFNAVRTQQMQVQHFEQLRSTRIMLALTQLPAHSNDGPVTFLEVNDDVR